MKKFYFIIAMTTILSIIIFIHPLTNYFESKYKYSISSDIKSKEVYSVSKNFVDYLNTMNEPQKESNSSAPSFKIANIYTSYKDSTKEFFSNLFGNTKSDDNQTINLDKNLSVATTQEKEIETIKSNQTAIKLEDSNSKEENIQKANSLINQVQLVDKHDFPEKIVEKIESDNNQNKKILLIGDSLMHAIASSLVSDLSSKGFSVTNLSKSSTGLTNKEFFNWEQVLKDELNKTSYQTVITIFGSNDAYSIFEKNKKLTFPSTDWSNFYKKRIDEILSLVKTNGAQIIWLETPCMRSPSFDNKIKILNGLFKEKIKDYGFTFFTTRDKICQNDQFVKILNSSSGSKTIRSDDGIHINKNGSSILSKEIVKGLKI